MAAAAGDRRGRVEEGLGVASDLDARVDRLSADQRLRLLQRLGSRAGAGEGDGAGDGAARLVAYVVGSGDRLPSERELGAYLRTRLPDFMVPSTFVALPAMPRTPNGKVDRRALPAPEVGGTVPAGARAGPRNAVEQRLTVIWADVLGVPGIGIHDDFFDLGGHSLVAMMLFARVREAFGTALPLATLLATPTIAGMAELLHKPAPYHRRSTLVAIQPKGRKRPLFCVHGVGGEVLCLRDLAANLDPGRPFYGLQAIGLDERDEPDTRVEQMAARYVAAMAEVDDQGPYLLAGFSSGGTIAFEMARQLHADGRRVAAVVVMETSPPDWQPRHATWHPRSLMAIAANLPWWIYDDVRRSSARELLGRGRGRLNMLRERVFKHRRRHLNVPLDADMRDLLGVQTLSEHRHRFLQTHYRAMLNYRPDVLDARITLVRTRTRPLFARDAHNLGWGRLAAGGVDVHVVPGAHDSILYQPDVQEVARRLRHMLDDLGCD